MNCCFLPKTELEFTSVQGKFIIQEIIGRGASSVVYRAIHVDQNENRTEHLLKEYHPDRVKAYREANGEIQFEDPLQQRRFKQGMKWFEEGYRRQIEFRKDPELTNITSNIQGIYQGYGTEFIDMTCLNGQSYDKIEESSLRNLIHRIIAITEAISIYHKKGYLHLDIKPENIFVLPETPDLVILFDFDSVVAKSEVMNESCRISYTPIWSAPEVRNQIPNSNIGEQADLYSIGMVFFDKLIGRLPIEAEHEAEAQYAFNINTGLLRNATPVTLNQITEIFHRTLSNDPALRWKSAAKLLRALRELEETLFVPTEVHKASVKDHRKKYGLMVGVLITAICISGGFLMRNSLKFNPSSQDLTPTLNEPVMPTEENTEDSEPVLAETEQQMSDTVDPSEPHKNTHTETETEVSEPLSLKVDYMLDTVASDLQNFRSMIMTNQGTIYYIDGNQLFTTKDGMILNLETDLPQSAENPYLAYDAYHDIIYLLSGGPLTVYDISEYTHPKVVLDPDSFFEGMVNLAHELSVTPQIAVLPDGSLLVPIDNDGTYRVNLKQQTVTPFRKLYNPPSPQNYALIGEKYIEYRSYESTAEITPIGGGEPVIIEYPCPIPDRICTYTDPRGLLTYTSGKGVSIYGIDGTYRVLIPQSSIQVMDYESLDNMNIWCMAANPSWKVSFYDNTLKSIRVIKSSCENDKSK